MLGAGGPAEAAQHLRRKHTVPCRCEHSGPLGAGPREQGPPSQLCCLPVAFRLLPASTFREHLLPQVKSENILHYDPDKRSSLAFSKMLPKKTKGKHKRNTL